MSGRVVMQSSMFTTWPSFLSSELLSGFQRRRDGNVAVAVVVDVDVVVDAVVFVAVAPPLLFVVLFL